MGGGPFLETFFSARAAFRRSFLVPVEGRDFRCEVEVSPVKSLLANRCLVICLEHSYMICQLLRYIMKSRRLDQIHTSNSKLVNKLLGQLQLVRRCHFLSCHEDMPWGFFFNSWKRGIKRRSMQSDTRCSIPTSTALHLLDLPGPVLLF